MKRGTIIGSAPILLVADVQKSASYYRDQLGFTYDRFWGDPPCFCMPRRDGHIVMLSQVDDPKHIVPHYKVVPNMWNVYFWVDDVLGVINLAQHDDVSVTPGHAEARRVSPETVIGESQLVAVVESRLLHVGDQ